MILITGGRGEDKTNFCKERFNFDNDKISDNNFFMLESLSEFLRDIYEEKALGSADEIMGYLNKFEIIIADEIGCGIVPMDKNERGFRDFYGNICCKLAKRADTVVRVICGLGQVLKGEIK